MPRLILKMSMSIDGFVGGPNGEVDWIFPSVDEGATAWTIESIRLAGLHVMGSRTFRDMAAYWPFSTEPFAAPMNEIPKLVFSKKGIGRADPTKAFEAASKAHEDEPKLSAAEAKKNLASWNDPIVATDLAGEIHRRKKEPGKDLVAHGGVSFAQSLLKQGLVDEYRLLVHPVVLGRGLALFSVITEVTPLTLLSSTEFPSGAVARIYRPTRGAR